MGYDVRRVTALGPSPISVVVSLSGLRVPAVQCFPEDRGPDNRCGSSLRGCGTGHPSELVFVSVPASLPFARDGDKPKPCMPSLSSESLLEVDAKTDDGDSPPKQGSHFLFPTTLNFGQG